MGIIIPRHKGPVEPNKELPVGTPEAPTALMQKFGIKPRTNDAAKLTKGIQLKSAPLEKKTPRFIEDKAVWEPPPPKFSGISLSQEDLDRLLIEHPLPPLPMGGPFILKDWQREDICTLTCWDRVGVFLPVGAGKTVIATLVSLAYNTRKRIVLVLPVLIRQWVSWLNSIPGTGGAVAYKGTKKQREKIDLAGNSWWVMSYGIFRNDFSKLHSMVEEMGPKSLTLIVDEAHAVKNVESWSHKRVAKMSTDQRLILMTGTELNSPMDSYAYITLKTANVYRGIGAFERIHIAAKDEYSGTVTEWKELDTMNRNLYLQSVHRTKEDVHSHLPEARYYPIPYELDDKHMELYRQAGEERLLELEDGGKVDMTTAQSFYTKMQQAVVDLSVLTGNPGDRSAAFDLIDMVIDEIDLGRPGNSKFIIWTWFKNTTRRVREYMETLFPGRVACAFSETNSDREVQRFMTDDNCYVLVAQPGSAGAGLNPQYICWESLFLEVPTRTIPFRQAAGRIDREGQRFNANVRIATAVGTIQESLYQNLLSNDQLVQKVQGNPIDLRKMIYGVGRG